ncbi:hypothetical protein GCM10028805_50680 [Spirosoma harenae]
MEEYFSPDNRFKVSLASNEIRMSHWIDSPYLTRISDDATLFTLNSLWSASDIDWLNASTVMMELRLYPGLLSCTVTLDIDQNKGEVSGQPGAFVGTLTQVQHWINNLENPSLNYRF